MLYGNHKIRSFRFDVFSTLLLFSRTSVILLVALLLIITTRIALTDIILVCFSYTYVFRHAPVLAYLFLCYVIFQVQYQQNVMLIEEKHTESSRKLSDDDDDNNHTKELQQHVCIYIFFFYLEIFHISIDERYSQSSKHVHTR